MSLTEINEKIAALKLQLNELYVQRDELLGPLAKVSPGKLPFVGNCLPSMAKSKFFEMLAEIGDLETKVDDHKKKFPNTRLKDLKYPPSNPNVAYMMKIGASASWIIKTYKPEELMTALKVVHPTDIEKAIGYANENEQRMFKKHNVAETSSVKSDD
jgi:hypothetical protein